MRYFKGTDSVTLIGEIEFVEEQALKEKLWSESDRRFFRKGIADPKFRLLKFTTLEATFWIEGKFRTCKYKKQLFVDAATKQYLWNCRCILNKLIIWRYIYAGG